MKLLNWQKRQSLLELTRNRSLSMTGCLHPSRSMYGFPETITLGEAAKRKNVSLSTIKYWIKNGKLEIEKNGRARLVIVDRSFANATREKRGKRY